MSTDPSIGHLLRWRFERAAAEAPPAPRAARLLALPRRAGHLVATRILRPSEEVEAAACVFSIQIRDGRLRLGFSLDAAGEPVREYQAMLLSTGAGSGTHPILAARASALADGEYYLEGDLPGDLAESWASLRVTARMPFRIMLRPVPAA
jgi:hypothetical protein